MPVIHTGEIVHSRRSFRRPDDERQGCPGEYRQRPSGEPPAFPGPANEFQIFFTFQPVYCGRIVQTCVVDHSGPLTLTR